MDDESGVWYSRPGNGISLAVHMERFLKGILYHRRRELRTGFQSERAAVVPRYLGLRVVIAKSYARIHWQNLINVMKEKG